MNMCNYNHLIAENMPEYGFFLTRIFPYIDRILITESSVLYLYRKIEIRENTYSGKFHSVLILDFICEFIRGDVINGHTDKRGKISFCWHNFKMFFLN